MQRFWIDKNQLQGGQACITGDQYHHICRVCRIEAGEHFELLTEGNTAYLVQMQNVGKKQALAQVIKERPIKAPPRPHIHLALAFARPHIVDRVVEKSVELGVHSVQLFASAKSQQFKNLKTQRWEKITCHTQAQCGRAHKMQLNTTKNLNECLLSFNNQFNKVPTLYILAYEKSEAGSPLNIFLQQQQDLGQIQDVVLFIGPEGGFTPQEVEIFSQHGVQPVGLGRQVLKVETACITLISILNYELGRMSKA